MWFLRDGYHTGSALVKKGCFFMECFFAYKKHFLFEFSNKSCMECNFIICMLGYNIWF